MCPVSVPAAIFVALLLTVARPASSEPVFSEVLTHWSSLALQGPGREVHDLRLTAGHLALVLTAGTAAPVCAGGEVVGLYFRGTGTLEYVSADLVESSIVSYNVGNNTKLTLQTADNALKIGSTFDEVLWLAPGTALPAFPTAEATNVALSGSLERHLKRFGEIQTAPAAHQFAAWRLNGPDRSLIRAEIGGGEDLVYLLDALEAKSESLMSVSKARTFADRRELIVLSDQPVGRPRQDPLVPPFLLIDVDLAVTAPGGEDLALSVTETFAGVGRATQVLRLDLYDTMFGRGELDPRRLVVKGVFDEAGKAVPFDHAKDELLVALAAPLAPGGQVKLRFEIQGKVLYRPAGDNFWELGVEPWFPQPDLAGQYFKVHTTVRVKKPFVPFAPGVTVRRIVEGDFNLLETRLDEPVQFMVVLAGNYAFEEETRDGITVRVASYGGKSTIGIRKLANLAHKIIDYYSGFMGPFPFKEFNIVEIDSWGFGQAPPGFMFITSEAFNPIGGKLNQLFSKGINERFSHEIAHQYWGHVVKMPSGEEQWLTESFAEICAGLFIRDLRGKSDFEGLVATWKLRAKQASATAPIPLANRIRNSSDRFSAFSARTALLYSKGPSILNSIRQDIGERPFLIFLNSVQSNLRWRFGSTKMVEVVLEAVTKKDWQPFFAANYWGTGMPAK